MWKSLSCVELHNVLPYGRPILLDGRSPDAYAQSHIFKSDLLESNTVSSFLAAVTNPSHPSMPAVSIIVLIEVGDADFNTVDEALKAVAPVGKMPPTYILNSTFGEFASLFSYYVETADVSIDASEGLYPSIIIPGRLYLGTGKQATNEKLVRRDVCITHIVNACDDFDCPFSNDGIEYLHFPIKDDEHQSIHNELIQMIAFVSKESSRNGRILIHCQMGRSRSGIMAIASYMVIQNVTLKEAYEHVVKCRPIVYPNDGFLRQLGDLEKELRGVSTLDDLLAAGVRTRTAGEKASSMKASLGQALLKKKVPT